jgi:hypothetical protein
LALTSVLVAGLISASILRFSSIDRPSGWADWVM